MRSNVKHAEHAHGPVNMRCLRIISANKGRPQDWDMVCTAYVEPDDHHYFLDDNRAKKNTRESRGANSIKYPSSYEVLLTEISIVLH